MREDILMHIIRKELFLLLMIVPLMFSMNPVSGSAEQNSETNKNEVFTTDFSEYETGKGVPKGWKELWNTSLYEVAESPSRLIKNSTKANRHLLAWEDVGEIEGDVEIATLMRVPGDTMSGDIGKTSFQLHLQASGEDKAIDTYHLDYTGAERQGLRIRRSIDHDQTTLDSKKEEFTFHTWNHVVFQKKGDTLRGKVWPYGTEEPNNWTVEAKDNTHNSGFAGIGFYSHRRTQEFAWFSVGTGDQDAERAPNNIDDISAPEVPDTVELEGKSEHGTVGLNWLDAEGAEYYDIERDGELIAQGWDTNSYADYTLPPDTLATYRIRGESTVKGKGDWSEAIEVKSPPLPDELVLPFEQDDGNPWTMHERELDFLDELEAVSSRVKVEEIGRSGEDRPMHLVRYGVDGPPDDEEIAERPTVLLNAGTHGDEKGSQEGMLLFMRELATSQDADVIDFLNSYAVLIIPKVNPDGAEKITRHTVNPAMDPNRDFVNLETSETQTVTKIMRDYQPDIVVDAHEWRGSPGSPQRGELEVSTHGNLNSYKDVRDLSQELAFDHLMAESNNYGGFRSSPYQELYGEPSRLRQIGGLKHGLTLLTEASRHPDAHRLEESDLEEDAPEFRPRRARATQFALREGARWMAENVERVTTATNASEEAAKTNNGPLYSEGSVDFPPKSDEIIDPSPRGWLISDADSRTIDILDLHGIKWEEQSKEEDVLFVPAAQLARPLAFIALDEASPDQLSSINSIRLSEGTGASSILTNVEHLEEMGEFENKEIVRTLKIHLTAVKKFEKQEKAEKVIKHMQAFKILLDHEKETSVISEHAHQSLTKDADTLIKQWE